MENTNGDNIKTKIMKISNEYGFYTYFYDYTTSEANNLQGEINIFLNKNQPLQDIWSDFCKLLGRIIIDFNGNR